jgi:hypothetical protein
MPRTQYSAGMKANDTIQIGWYIRQLLPLMYFTEYEASGQRKISVWRQWFGRVLWHKSYTVTP